MFRKTLLFFRRGKRPLPKSNRHPKFEATPDTHKPYQGGQQFFQHFLLKAADMGAKAAEEQAQSVSTAGADLPSRIARSLSHKLPQGEFAESRTLLENELSQEMNQLRNLDSFEHRRHFNELNWYEEQEKLPAPGQATPQDGEGKSEASNSIAAAGMPTLVNDDAYFKQTFGYSMIKKSDMPVTTTYGQLDLWAELPKYQKDWYFLYLISRRRNVYAVMYDYNGTRMMAPFTAGNRGFKGGDKGLKGEGSADTGHQVASQYINEVIPKIREREAQAGRSTKGVIPIVVRVLGFYNGRAGALKAVHDRADVLVVKYLEDVTPFPVNGPRMPKNNKRNWNKRLKI